MTNKSIKACGKCNERFTARDFVEHPDLIPIGMMFVGEEANQAYYLFQHETEACGSTLALRVSVLGEFVAEPIHERLLAQTDYCERHCVNLNDPDTCDQDCRMAPYRRLMARLMEAKWRLHVSTLT